MSEPPDQWPDSRGDAHYGQDVGPGDECQSPQQDGRSKAEVGDERQTSDQEFGGEVEEAGDERQSPTPAKSDAEVYDADLNYEAMGASAEYYAIKCWRSDCWSSQSTESGSYVDDPNFPEEADAELLALAHDIDTLQAMTMDGWKCGK